MVIYAAIAAFGFLVLLLMLVIGDLFGADHDLAGHDVALDHDAGGPSVFSARIMASFVTAFGVGGVVARYYDLPHPAASGIGVVCGALMASAVYQFARFLHSQQASSEVRMASLVGRSAEVVVAIPDGGVGQVTLTIGGERSDHIARSADGRAIARGSDVTITGLRGDLVVVTATTPAASGGAR
jgi:membrane protein implicated in regulation of membrane protease activity